MRNLIAGFVCCMLFTAGAGADERGPGVSLELRDVEIRDVLRALGQEHNLNMIIDDAVVGKVTVSLRNVPLWDAVDSLLKGKGYSYVREGNIIRVVPASEDENFLTQTVQLNHSKPKDMETLLKRFLSKKGEVAADVQSNSVVIKDYPANLARAVSLVQSLDLAPAQVMIDARIIELVRELDRSLGIQWGGTYRGGDVTVSGATGVENFAVNLPAALSRLINPLGAIRFGIIAGDAAIDVKLSALELNGDIKILSNPRIMTANNKKAMISTGQKIWVRQDDGTTVITGGSPTTTTTTTQEIEALLKLEVTPQISSDEKITMNVMIKKDEFNWARQVDNIPAIDTREASTDVMVRTGDTLVIGGIFRKHDTTAEFTVPYLARLPLLGALFRRDDTYSETSELLIFLTPSVRQGVME